MTAYLIRRFFQMILVVLLSTLAIYILLNVAPGGPLSGIRMGSADRKQQVSEDDIKRLESYLGIDKPLFLRYICWLVGDDWLGADWMSLSWDGYTVERGKYVNVCPPKGRQPRFCRFVFRVEGTTSYRFWADPGVAHLNPDYDIWVVMEDQGDGPTARYIQYVSPKNKPRTTPPEGAIEVKVSEIQGANLVVKRVGGSSFVLRTTPDTRFEIEGVRPRPSDGAWVYVGWLSSPYRGVLNSYAGFHGDSRGVLRFDWGESWAIAKGQPVSMLVESRLVNTLILMSAATVLSLIVAVPIGVISAVKQYSFLDYAVTTFSFFGSAMPVFWFGLMLVLLFSYKFMEWGIPFMPASGVVSLGRIPPGSLLDRLGVPIGGAADRIIHLILPTVVLSLLYMAGWSRFTRSSMLEVLRQDYVRTARSKGLRERVVLAKHALRNALIPLVTIVVFQLPGIFGGAILTETVFDYDGMGKLYWASLTGNDWPVAMVLLLIQAVLVVIATLLGDILYTIVDPRIRLE